mgnify:CR=1 FL=1
MPKTNFCKPSHDVRLDYIREVVDGGMARLNIKTKELASKTGINEYTLYKRRRQPETFTIQEFLKVLDVLKPDEGFEKKVLSKGAGK